MSKHTANFSGRKDQFMYGKALSYVDSVTRQGVFRERTNIRVDQPPEGDGVPRGSTREAFLSLRFPLLGPNRKDANIYHRLKRKNRGKRAKSPSEGTFDIRNTHVNRSPHPQQGFLPAIDTHREKYLTHSWDAQSYIENRPRLYKNATQYQSLPDIRHLNLPPKGGERGGVKISSADRVMLPSLHGYHRRSQSPTYKKLIAVKESLSNTINNWVKEFYHISSVDENISVDEFYSKFLSLHERDDDDVEASDLSTHDQELTDCISLLRSRTRMELWIDKNEFETRVLQVESSARDDDETQQSVFSILAASENPSGDSESQLPPNFSPTQEGGGGLRKEMTADSLSILREASKANVEGWGEPNKDQEFVDLKGKVERRKTQVKVNKQNKKIQRESIPETSREPTKAKMSVTDNISANLDAVLARINSLDDKIDLDSVGKALENIGGKPKMRQQIEREKTKISPEEIKRREKVKAAKEKIQKSRPIRVGDLMYEKHKAKAVHRLAQLSNLTAEEANDLFLTRDHKVLSQKFIDKYNDVAFGSDSSDDEDDC